MAFNFSLLTVTLICCQVGIQLAHNYYHHAEIHQTIINSCHTLPFLSLFFKNRCIVQRDGVDCAEITQSITSNFPEFEQMDIKQLGPEFVKHIQRINFFKDFKQSDEFCVISCLHACPTDFIMYNGMCFRLVKERRNFEDAKKFYLIIREFKQSVWLGIQNYPEDNQWLNFNGTHKVEPIYYRWMFFDGAHKNAIMDYGIYNGFWRSAAASEQHPFVCQHRLTIDHKH